MSIKKVLVIEVSEPVNDRIQIVISHANRSGDNVSPITEDYDIINDMATLCEALCILIRTAENEKIKSSPQSLRDCIHHLEQGTFDAKYEAIMVKPNQN